MNQRTQNRAAHDDLLRALLMNLVETFEFEVSSEVWERCVPFIAFMHMELDGRTKEIAETIERIEDHHAAQEGEE